MQGLITDTPLVRKEESDQWRTNEVKCPLKEVPRKELGADKRKSGETTTLTNRSEGKTGVIRINCL